MAIKSFLCYSSLCLVVTFFGCKDTSAANMQFTDGDRASSPEGQIESTNNANNGMKYRPAMYQVKEGNLSFETENIKTSRILLDSLLYFHHGFVSKENLLSSGIYDEYKITVKVPAQNFEKFIQDIEKTIPNQTSKNIQVIDVTEEFTDIQSRIKIKKELEKRYLHLLEKAEKMDDILKLEGELNSVRTEIEVHIGRNNALSHKIACSTMEILIRNKIPEKNENTFFDEIKIAFKNGVKYVGSFSLFLVNLWPFILVGLGIYFVIRKKRMKSVN